MVMSDPVERVPGSTEITSPSITASRRVDWTSTVGVSPVTTMVSSSNSTEPVDWAKAAVGITAAAEQNRMNFFTLDPKTLNEI